MSDTPIIEKVARTYATDWDSASPDMQDWWRIKSAEALRVALPWPAFSGDVDALIRELYPERFR